MFRLSKCACAFAFGLLITLLSVLLRFRPLLCRRPVFSGDAGDRRPLHCG